MTNYTNSSMLKDKINAFAQQLQEEMEKRQTGFIPSYYHVLPLQGQYLPNDEKNEVSDAVAHFPLKTFYHVNDFINLHDEVFIEVAYLAILNRKADPIGKENFLLLLRSEKCTRIEILARLRYSPEGRLNKIYVKGLVRKLLLKFPENWPILGYVYRFCKNVLCLLK